MRDIVLKVGNSPSNINDYERYVASCITKLLTQLKLELGIDYSIGQGGSFEDWKLDKSFGIKDGLFIALSIKKWQIRKPDYIMEKV